MERVTEILLQLICSEVCSHTLRLSDKTFSDKDLIDLLILSRKHGVSQMVASVLMNNGLLNERMQEGQFLNEIYTAVYTQERMSATCDEIYKIFEEEHLPYIPLKGAVVRALYPQPWMRTSCDVDVLVREKDLDRAVRMLEAIEGYTIKGRSNHDVVFISGNGTAVELHYKLLGNKRSPLYSKVLKDVWQTAKLVEGTKSRYSLSDDIFYFYHILHMAKHFRLGGCGIRPFLDLWLMEKSHNYDSPTLKKMLKKSGLEKFAENVRKLSRVWFSGEEYTEVTRIMEQFVTEGGSFGTHKTRIFANKQRKGGRVGYIISRLFVPRSYLERDYPILKKYPALTPFYAVHRWVSILFGKKKYLKDRYTDGGNNISDDNPDMYYSLFDMLGLK